ncbi:MAG: glycerol-3-phosphate 1-O-acyltransferase PlsY [Candidatus Omnitrophica bacterium]|nr:glycerol-3-phosphate 1-O-acyltransferase PlsY [Candidatus Omnitrophota bacterium]MDD4012963.1 glycerol-3-phosphate 1-O-acyltransferase PlsY [Candidatus Omnitrophota bacterium]
MIYYFAAAALGYLIGSIPTAFIFAKALKGIDIRQCGSGNVGATNVFRTIGKGPGIAVFVIDFVKGFAAVLIVPALVNGILMNREPLSDWARIVPGVAAILGHIWTIFLSFKGGKGVSTTAGVMAALAPLIFISGLGTWLIVFRISGYVSLASIAAAISLPIASLVLGEGSGFIALSGVLCVLGVFSHRTNIKRLMNGTENKFVKHKKAR